jgi:hypothetical protein
LVLMPLILNKKRPRSLRMAGVFEMKSNYFEEET